jgi:hypothetical protein
MHAEPTSSPLPRPSVRLEFADSSHGPASARVEDEDLGAVSVVLSGRSGSVPPMSVPVYPEGDRGALEEDEDEEFDVCDSEAETVTSFTLRRPLVIPVPAVETRSCGPEATARPWSGRSLLSPKGEGRQDEERGDRAQRPLEPYKDQTPDEAPSPKKKPRIEPTSTTSTNLSADISAFCAATPVLFCLPPTTNGEPSRLEASEEDEERPHVALRRQQLDGMGVTPFVRMRDPFAGLDMTAATPSPIPSFEGRGNMSGCQLFTPSPIPASRNPPYMTEGFRGEAACSRPHVAANQAPRALDASAGVVKKPAFQHSGSLQLSPSVPPHVTTTGFTALCPPRVFGFGAPRPEVQAGPATAASASGISSVTQDSEGKLTRLERLAYAASPPAAAREGHRGGESERPLNDDSTPLRLMKQTFAVMQHKQHHHSSAPEAEPRASDTERNDLIRDLRLSFPSSGPAADSDNQSRGAAREGDASPAPWALLKSSRCLRAQPAGPSSEMSLEEYLLSQQTASATHEAESTREGKLFEREQKVKFLLKHKLDVISRALESHDRGKRGKLSVRDCIFFIGMHVLEAGDRGKASKEVELFETIHAMLNNKRRRLLLAQRTTDSSVDAASNSTKSSVFLRSSAFGQPPHEKPTSPSHATRRRPPSPASSSSRSLVCGGPLAPNASYAKVSRTLIDYTELLEMLGEL